MSLQTYDGFLPSLIEARVRRGMTQEQLADALDVNRSAVSHWEAGRRVPSQENAEQWAKFLEVRLPAHAAVWFSRKTRSKEPRHGTRNGYFWHQRHGAMPACDPCKAAAAEYAAERRARQAASSR